MLSSRSLSDHPLVSPDHTSVSQIMRPTLPSNSAKTIHNTDMKKIGSALDLQYRSIYEKKMEKTIFPQPA